MQLLAILYGSQTGNAEDMAKRIGLKANLLGFKVLVEAIDDFPLKYLPKQTHVLFVCSTTGHGQEPENMKNFYNFIRRRDLPKTCLSQIKYAVYGLGDSSYAKFNYVSKIVFKRLRECGAEPIQDLVIGDEQHQLGCDGTIYPGLDRLWSTLCPDSLVDEEKAVASSYAVRFYGTDKGPAPTDLFRDEYRQRYNLKTALCITNRRVTSPNHFQDTRFLCFRAEEPIEYEPGDVCTILPTNSDENVNQFIDILGLDPNQRFCLEKRDHDYMKNYLYDFIPDGLTVRDLVRNYLDIQSVPRRSFFEFLWPFSDDQLERDKLREFSSTDGQEEMYEYCVQPKRSILEVLLDFPNTVRNIKFEYIFDLVPPIKPRSFSIASSCNQHPNEIHLIVGVVNYQTRLRKTRKGLCSNYLARLVPHDSTQAPLDESKLRFFIKSTSFKLPKEPDRPVILIGPGLGIAPFRAFIEERLRSDTHDQTTLYFGCRYRQADFYFRDELEDYSSQGYITLRVAFSREKPKQYIQDLLLEDSELVNRQVMQNNAMIYVAGNSKLPEDLRSLLKKILVYNDGDNDHSRASDELIASLESQGRIQYDCW